MNKSEINGDQISVRQVAKVAGAFVAWIIGAGFATGREILSFFQLWLLQLWCHLNYTNRFFLYWQGHHGNRLPT